MRNSLHDAASAGDSNKALALLKGDPALVFSKDENDATPLHHAARGEPNRYTHDGHLAVAKLLIAHAADVNARDKQEFTSLFCAAGSGNVGVCGSAFGQRCRCQFQGLFRADAAASGGKYNPSRSKFQEFRCGHGIFIDQSPSRRKCNGPSRRHAPALCGQYR